MSDPKTEDKIIPKVEEEEKQPKKKKKKKKKGDEEDEKYSLLLMGRAKKNNLEMGIVGLPNVGKSTLFSTLTKRAVAIGNRAFVTGPEPNIAQVIVPDKRFDHLVKEYEPKSEKPATLKIHDIAGLIKGASEGSGLGNEFLSCITRVDGIYHLVRAFKDKEISHYEGEVDPVRDLDIISRELRLKDIQVVKNHIQKIEKVVKKGGADKATEFLFATASKALKALEEGIMIRNVDWESKEVPIIIGFYLLTAKPAVYLVNVSKKDFLRGGNRWFIAIKEWVEKNENKSIVIPYCGSVEYDLSFLSDDEKKEYLKEHKVKSQCKKIITEGYKALNLINYFTAGKDECAAWTIRKGVAAPRAAGVIHGDFEDTFIKAETIGWKDFKKYGEKGCKQKGKLQMNGSDYIVKDGDVMHFKFGKGKKKKK